MTSDLPHTFPHASLDGFDLNARYCRYAREAGVADHVNFALCDVITGLPRQYALVTMRDVVHDLPDHGSPAGILRAVGPSAK